MYSKVFQIILQLQLFPMILSGKITSLAILSMELNMLVFVLALLAHLKIIGSVLQAIHEEQESEQITPSSTLGHTTVKLSLMLAQYQKDGKCQNPHEALCVCYASFYLMRIHFQTISHLWGLGFRV